MPVAIHYNVDQMYHRTILHRNRQIVRICEKGSRWGHDDLTFNFTLLPTEQEIRIISRALTTEIRIAKAWFPKLGLEETGSKARRRGVKFEISISTSTSRLVFQSDLVFRAFLPSSRLSRAPITRFFCSLAGNETRSLETQDVKWAMDQWQDHMPKSSWAGRS